MKLKEVGVKFLCIILSNKLFSFVRKKETVLNKLSFFGAQFGLK
jgi:hypothetical protein